MKWMFGLGLLALSLNSACGGDTATPEETATCNGGKCDIIGEDDRYDEFSGQITERLKLAAKSTAIVVANEVMTEEGDTTFFAAQRLGDTYGMCPGEPFENQPVTGFCSAWLVAPDIMVTNGHCIPSQQACETSSFVFDYALTTEGDEWLDRVPTQNVYACDRIVAWDYTSNCDVDYAVVRLKRRVEDRDPLDVRSSTDELDSENLVIIGHPFGLPRKYALNGQLVASGSNTFTTTHDIIGGNSGSAIFDAETGEVQGLVTCGGSNFDWEYYNEGWSLDRKTGKTCDTSCDDDGVYVENMWEDCANGQRRRCVCSGDQLVWEKRACLAFEDQTGGQCSREAKYDQFSCDTAPWLCAIPLAQHTKAFSHFTDRWEVFESNEPLAIEKGAEVTSTVDVNANGVAQALTVLLDFLPADQTADVFPWAELEADLTVTLTHDDQTYVLAQDGVVNSGTAYPVSTSPGGAQAYQVPLTIHDAQLKDVRGPWTLTIKNNTIAAYQLNRWSLQTIAKPESQITDFGMLPCVLNCVSSDIAGPDPVVEDFTGPSVDINTENVSGTLTAGWEVEIIDASAQYEVIKTRRSQTMSLETGEFALVKDFAQDIGGRELTIDYRYDGDGWFQVYADSQMLLAKQSFSQGIESVTIPIHARKIRIIMGATDGTRVHEASINRLELAPGPPTAGFTPCVTSADCGPGYTCTDTGNGESVCLQEQ
ncbi:MAG: serine protease [bacterium]